MCAKTVLVVDDEPDLVDLFARYLKDEYSVLTAYDGLEAMDVIDESVDLVTLDLRMAGVTGGQVLVWFREEGYHCPVIVVSAIDPYDAELPVAPDAFLEKPVTRKELLAAVRQFMP